LLEDEDVENAQDAQADSESDADEKQRAEKFFSEDEVNEADKVNAY